MTKEQQRDFLNQISKGKIKETIDGLMKLRFSTSQKTILTGIAAQHQLWQQKKIKGILSAEQDNLQQNQITNRLIAFINQTDEPSLKIPFWKNKGIQWLGIIGSLASIIALWFVFFPPTASNNTKTVTVLVHGKEGKDDIVLPNRGIVYLIYGDAKIPEQINNEGEATFKQIPESFFAADSKVEILFEDPEGEPYKAAFSDSLYNLKPNSHIALQVVLLGMEQISGIVKDFETGKAIESATIRVFGKSTLSNEFGEFVLDIPEAQQQQFITLRVFKEGYQDWEMKDIPTTTNQKITIPLKK